MPRQTVYCTTHGAQLVDDCVKCDEQREKWGLVPEPEPEVEQPVPTRKPRK